MLATVNPNGSPQTSVVWVGRDGGDLLFSTVEGRVKHRNMLRDPRVSVDRDRFGGPGELRRVRGRVSMPPDIARRVDTELSWKYDGKDPGEDRPGAARVVVRMVVEKVTRVRRVSPGTVVRRDPGAACPSAAGAGGRQAAAPSWPLDPR